MRDDEKTKSRGSWKFEGIDSDFLNNKRKQQLPEDGPLKKNAEKIKEKKLVASMAISEPVKRRPRTEYADGQEHEHDNPIKDEGDDYTYAGFFARIIAYIIDYAFLSALSTGLAHLMGVQIADQENLLKNLALVQSSEELIRQISILISHPAFLQSISFSLIAAFLIYVFPVAFWGKTPGKKIIGLRIIHLAPEVRIGLVRAAWRFLMMTSMMFILPILLMLFNKQKRTLHDYLSGTKVIHD